MEFLSSNINRNCKKVIKKWEWEQTNLFRGGLSPPSHSVISLTEQCLKLTELPSTFSATGKQNCLTIRMQHARHPKFNMDAILDPFWNAKSQWNICTYMPYKLEANYTKYKTPVLSKSKTGSGQQYIGDIIRKL